MLISSVNGIGGDPQTALDAGTFAPGDVNDNTGAGNTCDTDDCIFLENLLVPVSHLSGFIPSIHPF